MFAENMLKSILPLLFLIPLMSPAQESSGGHFPNNTIYISSLGQPENVLAINYERRLLTFKSISTFASIGAGHSIPDRYNGKAKWYEFPAGLSFVTGKTNHHFEFAAGYGVVKYYNRNIQRHNESVIKITGGYRLQRPNEKGISLRVALGPAFSSYWDGDYRASRTSASVSAGLGYAF